MKLTAANLRNHLRKARAGYAKHQRSCNKQRCTTCHWWLGAIASLLDFINAHKRRA